MPAEDTPPRKSASQGYWEAVLRHAKANPNVWIPLLNPPFSRQRIYDVAKGVESKTPGVRRKAPVCLRVPGFHARVREATFWFRYDPPAPGE